jgi:hypothetical protein
MKMKRILMTTSASIILAIVGAVGASAQGVYFGFGGQQTYGYSNPGYSYPYYGTGHPRYYHRHHRHHYYNPEDYDGE